MSVWQCLKSKSPNSKIKHNIFYKGTRGQRTTAIKYKYSFQLQEMLIVEVCQGPDCSGGGAALLEIEELIQEEQSRKDIKLCLVEGGCRDFCTVGPNVHIRHKHRGSLESFHDVNDGSKCSLVVESAIRWDRMESSCMPQVASQPSSAQTGSRQSIMARRAKRMRWEALKDISRRLTKCKKDIDNNPDLLDDQDKCQRKFMSFKDELSHALDQPSNAEISAAYDQMERDRARRRRERLNRNICGRLEVNFQD